MNKVSRNKIISHTTKSFQNNRKKKIISSQKYNRKCSLEAIKAATGLHFFSKKLKRPQMLLLLINLASCCYPTNYVFETGIKFK